MTSIKSDNAPTPSGRSTTRIRVLELAGKQSGIASAFAGWLLAGMGAEVTRLARRPVANDGVPSPESLTIEALSDGKETHPFPEGPANVKAMLADSDILICDASSGLEAAAGSVTSLTAAHPELIVGIANTFGLTGPYAGLPGSALDAQAISGISWALGEPGRSPLSLPPGIAEHQSGAMLAAGCLLALLRRDAGHGGRVVDISLADTLASFVAGACRYFVHHGLAWERSGRRASGSGGAYPFTILPCADGLVCVCGRTRDEWNRLVRVMGNPEWSAEPRYQKLRAMGREYPEEVDALVMPWLARHTMAELETIALENGLIVSPLRELSEVLETPHFSDRNILVNTEVRGRKLQTPAPPFRVMDTRSLSAVNLAPGLLREAWKRPSETKSTSGAPLAGLRVIDLGWVWSAPWVSTMLGELGAEVIKVEHGKRPDNLRLAGKIVRNGGFVDGPSMEMSPMYHQVNHGKLGITLNIKEPEGGGLLKQLVEKSDVVIENMSPGSLERSGLGYRIFKEVNPRIVMLAMSVAGQFGALTGMRAYAPTMSSFVGMESLIGYPGEEPIGALNLGLSDPSASVHALVPLLAALRRAGATGKGCYIDFGQIEALLGTLRPYLLSSQLTGNQPPPVGNRHPRMAPHGIYPAAGEDNWLTLTIPDDAAWRSFTGIAAGQTWAADPDLATTPGRLERAENLDRVIAAWTATFERDSLIADLRSAGLASFPVHSVEDLWGEPHFEARRMKIGIDIPIYGPDTVFTAPWKFSDFSPLVSRCGPSTGEHNHLVFGELLGLTSAQIEDLETRGIIA